MRDEQTKREKEKNAMHESMTKIHIQIQVQKCHLRDLGQTRLHEFLGTPCSRMRSCSQYTSALKSNVMALLGHGHCRSTR